MTFLQIPMRVTYGTLAMRRSESKGWNENTVRLGLYIWEHYHVKCKGFLSYGTKQTVHNNEVSIIKWVSIKWRLTVRTLFMAPSVSILTGFDFTLNSPRGNGRIPMTYPIGFCLSHSWPKLSARETHPGPRKVHVGWQPSLEKLPRLWQGKFILLQYKWWSMIRNWKTAFAPL